MLIVIKKIYVQSLPLPQSLAYPFNTHMLIGLPYKKCFMYLMDYGAIWVKLLLGMLEKHWRIDIMFQHFRLVGLALLLSIGVGSA
jgi:hypothetical protein